MPLADNQNDQVLVQYLLGCLSVEETERLDELSITDDDFATRLSVAENNLVDEYVRGELAADTAEQFRSAYASSPRRRAKLKFAESLLFYQKREAAAPMTVQPAIEPTRRKWRFFTLPGLVPQWGFAALAIALLFATGYLGMANQRLRDQLIRVGAERISLEQRAQQLARQLENKSPESAEGPAAESQQLFDRIKIAAFVLTPAIRGAGQLPDLAVSPDLDAVVLKLELEASGFARYRAALEDSDTRQILWRSTDLKPLSEGDKKTLSFTFYAKLLKRRNYVMQLSGIHGDGSAELVSGYPFRVIVK